MNTVEMSDMFDELVGAYLQTHDTPKDMLAFNEYEKSLFLTQAQEQLVISLYDGRNSAGNMFELTEEDRRYLSDLVNSVSLEPEEDNGSLQHIYGNSQFFQLPSDLMFITYESCTLSGGGDCIDGRSARVLPVTQDEFQRIVRNPFRGIGSGRVLRLDISDNIVELVSQNTVGTYFVRYVKRPRPIILVSLADDNLTIQGENEVMDCELNPLLHERIVRYAVQLALQSRNIKQQ